MRSAEYARLTIREANITFREMINAIEDSLSDLVSSANEEEGEDDEDEETKLGRLSEDNEPCWVVDTIS